MIKTIDMQKLDKNRIYTLICVRKFVWYDWKYYFSWLISIVQKFLGQHVLFAWHDGSRWMCAEASTGKVRCLPLENWMKSTRWYPFVFDDAYSQMKRNEMIQYAYKCENIVKYDFLGLVWMWIYIKRKIWIGRSENQNKRQFCSEFYFNAKGIKGAQYKSIKDAYLCTSFQYGKLELIQDDEAIVINKFLTDKWQ